MDTRDRGRWLSGVQLCADCLREPVAGSERTIGRCKACKRTACSHFVGFGRNENGELGIYCSGFEGDDESCLGYEDAPEVTARNGSEDGGR